MTSLALLSITLLLVALGLFLILRKLIGLTSEVKTTRQTIRVDIEKTELRLYRQLESLFALNSLLRFDHPLPPLREWAGSPDFLLELCREVLARKPKRIVECSSGVSTLVAARCCQLNDCGHVYSLENSPEYARKTRAMLEKSGLTNWGTVIEAPLLQQTFEDKSYSWYTTEQLPSGPIDILVIDGPLGSLNEHARYPAGPMLFPRLNDDAVVIIDDARRPDESRIIERWLQQFPTLQLEMREAEKGLALLKVPR